MKTSRAVNFVGHARRFLTLLAVGITTGIPLAAVNIFVEVRTVLFHYSVLDLSATIIALVLGAWISCRLTPPDICALVLAFGVVAFATVNQLLHTVL